MSPLALLVIPMDFSFYIFGLEYKPWRFFLTCTSLINLWNAVVFTFLPETPKFLLAMNRKEEAVQVLKRTYAFNTGQTKEVFYNRNCFVATISLDLPFTRQFTVLRYKFYVFPGISSEKYWKRHNGQQSIWCQRNIWLLHVGCRTNETNIPATIIRTYLEALLHHIRNVCNRTWHFHVVNFEIEVNFQFYFIWSPIFANFDRFPDFLLQLLGYAGSPETLCNIVGPKTVANVTEQMYVLLS